MDDNAEESEARELSRVIKRSSELFREWGEVKLQKTVEPNRGHRPIGAKVRSQERG